MATSQQKSEMRLQVRRVFSAPREKVFRAWIERQGLEQWMCRDVPTHRVKYLELEVKTGGHYVMEVTDAATGEVYLGQGTFREVTRRRNWYSRGHGKKSNLMAALLPWRPKLRSRWSLRSEAAQPRSF